MKSSRKNLKSLNVNEIEKKCKEYQSFHYFFEKKINTKSPEGLYSSIAQFLLTLVQKLPKAKQLFSIVAAFGGIHIVGIPNVLVFQGNIKRNSNNMWKMEFFKWKLAKNKISVDSIFKTVMFILCDITLGFKFFIFKQ